MKVVFNDDCMNDSLFQIFSEANSIKALWFEYNTIDPKIYRSAMNYLSKSVFNPNPNSLVYLSKKYYLLELKSITNEIEQELVNQIPHWIFPIVGLISINMPRMLLFLCNHQQIFQKLIEEINSIENIENAKQIHDSTYIRYCLLETFRLNNPVVTTFRTLLTDYYFDQFFFKKGEQFLILNNPVLRDPITFKHPNQYIPERWTQQLENSYQSIMFNQGPQKCPGKELTILLMGIFLVNYLKYSGILKHGCGIIQCNKKLDTLNIPQMINPCDIKFSIHWPPK